MEEIKAKIRHGIFDPAAYFPEYRGLARVGAALPQVPTFKTVAENYLRTATHLAHSTHLSYKRALAGHWYAAIGDRPIDAIRQSEVLEVLAPLRAKTRNNVLIPVRQVIDYAIADEILDRSPIAKLKNVGVQADLPDPYSVDEAEAIIAGLPNATVADYYEFAFFSGLRASEQIAITWRDHDRQKGLLRVERARVWGKDKDTTKTGLGRDVELLDRAAAVLERQRARTELANGAIFWNPITGRAWNDEQVQRRYFDATVKRLGIRHRPPKQTRHTFATMCLMAPANPAWVARQLGHKSLKMFFEVYSRWIDGADKGAERGRVEAFIRPQFGREPLAVPHETVERKG